MTPEQKIANLERECARLEEANARLAKSHDSWCAATMHSAQAAEERVRNDNYRLLATLRDIATALSLKPESSAEAVLSAARGCAKDRERLKEALAMIQWGNVTDVPGGLPYYLCPLCDQIEANGHSPDCHVGAALDATEKER